MKGNSGVPLSPPPYGYIKNPEDPRFWVIDPEAAEVVRRIYQMALTQLSFIDYSRFKATRSSAGFSTLAKLYKISRVFLLSVSCILPLSLIQYSHKPRMIAATECRAHGLTPIISLFLIGVSNQSGLGRLFLFVT